MSETPIVGREAQLDELGRWLGRALTGRASVCFVTGEPGAGKTSLLSEFGRRAQAQVPNLLVAIGKCDAYTGSGDAYLPFREVLQQLSGDVERSAAEGRSTSEGAGRLRAFAIVAARAMIENGPDLLDVFVPCGGLLSRVGARAVNRLPWVQRLSAHIEDAPARTTSAIRQDNVFEQYTQVLETMASQQPLVLILDDLHWADGASTALLFHLARRMRSVPVLLIGAYRQQDVASSAPGQPHALEGVVAELRREFGEITIDLDAAQGREFVESLLAARPNRLSVEFHAEFARHTGGNALFAIELLRTLEESGALVVDASGQLVQEAPIAWSSLPARVAGVIESRVARLSAAQREILSVAAVEGEEFTADVVAQVTGVARRDVVRELSGPLQKAFGLVAAVGLDRVGERRVARYRFRHNLMQDHLYRQLDDIERAELHRDVGVAIESMHAPDTDAVAVQLVHHFGRAGLWEQTVRYGVRAGLAAIRASAPGQAIDHLTAALEIWDRHRGEMAGVLLDAGSVAEALGDQLLLAGRHDEAMSRFHAAQDSAPADDVIARARIERKIAAVHERQRHLGEALQALEGAAETLGRAAPVADSAWCAEWIETWLALAHLHYWRGDVAKIDAAHATLEPIVLSAGTAVQRAGFYASRVRRGLRQLRYRADAAVLEDAGRAAELVGGLPIGPDEAHILFMRGFTLLWAERLGEAEAALDRALAESRRIGDAMLRTRCLVYLGVVRRRLGRVECVRQVNAEVRDLLRQLATDEYLGIVEAQAAWLAWKDGDADGAREAVLKARAAWATQRNRYMFQWAALWVAMATAVEHGDPQVILECASTMLQPSQMAFSPDLEQSLKAVVAHASDGSTERVATAAIAATNAARAEGFL